MLIVTWIVEFILFAVLYKDDTKKIVNEKFAEIRASYPFIFEKYKNGWTFDDIKAEEGNKTFFTACMVRGDAAYSTYMGLFIMIFMGIAAVISIVVWNLGGVVFGAIADLAHIARPTDNFLMLLTFLITIIHFMWIIKRSLRTNPIEKNNFIVNVTDAINDIQSQLIGNHIDQTTPADMITIPTSNVKHNS